MDLLGALKSFVRVAEAGSFSAVSRETGVSQPTVSRHVAELEEHFKARLFNRTTRSLSLTDDGRSLLAYAHDLMDLVGAAEASLRGTSVAPTGLVRVGTTTALGLYLTTHIGRLLQRWPLLSVEVVMRDAFGNMVEEGLDLAIRIGEFGDSQLITRKLVNVERILVGSPTYLQRAGRPNHPDDLNDHHCIAYTYGEAKREWSFYPRHGQSAQAIVTSAEGQFRANNSESVHRAAIEGIGLAVLPAFQVRDDIAGGTLVRLMPDWRLPDLTMHLVYPGPRKPPLRTRVVMEFLSELAPALEHLVL